MRIILTVDEELQLYKFRQARKEGKQFIGYEANRFQELIIKEWLAKLTKKK